MGQCILVKCTRCSEFVRDFLKDTHTEVSACAESNGIAGDGGHTVERRLRQSIVHHKKLPERIQNTLERDVSTKFLILTFDKRRLMRRLGDT
jgi:hypothetical protein